MFEWTTTHRANELCFLPSKYAFKHPLIGIIYHYQSINAANSNNNNECCRYPRLETCFLFAWINQSEACFLKKVHISKYVFSCGKCGFLGDFFKLALTSSHSTSHLSSFWGLWTFAWWAKGPPKMIHVLPLLTCYLVVFSRVFHFLCTFCTNLLPTFWILVGFLVCGF